MRLKHLACLKTDIEDPSPRPSLDLESLESGTGKLAAGDELRVSSDPGAGVAQVAEGDVLFGKLRPYLAKSWVADRPCFASTELLCLRPKSGVDSRWLGYVVASRRFVEFAIATSDGAKMPRTSWSKLAEFRQEVPDLASQESIADHLDCETERIDALFATKKKMVQLLREKVVASRRTSLGRAIKSPKSLPLRRLVTCLDGQRIPLNREERALRAGSYPYWGAGSVVDRIDDYLFDEELVLLGEDGAPFFDDSRDVAFRVQGRIWVNNHIHVLRCRAGADAGWLRHMLNAVDYAAYISGSTRDKLTQEEMMEIRIPALGLHDQVRAREELDALERRAARISQLISRQVPLLTEQRQALITKAVTGSQSAIPRERRELS